MTQWHQVRDLLTVRYFTLRDGDSPGIRKINSRGHDGLFHSGLTAEELKNQARLLRTFRETVDALCVSIGEGEILA